MIVLAEFVQPARATLDDTGGMEFIDYCMVGGLVLTAWLAIVYWNVLRVQEKCFKSDLMEFNVWEELMWMMQQQRLQKLQGDHVKGKKLLGKLQPTGTAAYTAPPMRISPADARPAASAASPERLRKSCLLYTSPSPRDS